MKKLLLAFLFLLINISVVQAQFAGGTGAENDPFQIASVEHLQKIQNYLDMHFIQISDIDASDTRNWNEGLGFEPIGTDTDRFSGSYDGGGYSISGLYVNRPIIGGGLFGNIENAKLRNVTLVDVNIEASAYSGALAGVTSGASTFIENCFSSGIVSGTGQFYGGLVGRLNVGATVVGSSSSANVTGSSSVGGLVGGVYTSVIKKSSASGNVTGVSRVGGLAGSASGEISESYASGNVVGSSSRVGGLVGWGLGKIEKSYATGAVEGDFQVGGLVGLNDDIPYFRAEISNSYSVGTVSGNSAIGGFIGQNVSIIRNSYNSLESNAVVVGIESVPTTGLERRTLDQMSGVDALYNLSSLDFDEIWKLTTKTPALWWEMVEQIPFPAPLQPALLFPNDNQILIAESTLFEWEEDTPTNQQTFIVEISRLEDFSSLIFADTVSQKSLSVANLDGNSTNWWRVKAENQTGSSPYSDVKSFYVTYKTVSTSGEIVSGVSQLSEDVYLTSSTDDRVYSFDRNGKILWTVQTGGELQSAIAVDQNGDIFVGSTDTRLYSFDNDGIPNWDRPLGGIILSSPSIGEGDLVFLGINTGRFFALSKENGNIAWNLQTDGAISSSASIDNNGNVYFGSHDKKFYALTGNGQLLWAYETDGIITGSAAITSDGDIVFPSNDGRLYKLDSSGALIWSFETGGSIVSSPAIGPAGVIFFGSGDGKLYAVSENGEKLWDYDLGHPVNGTPALSGNGMLFIGSDDGMISGFTLQGDLVKQYLTGGAVRSPVLISANNIIYISSTDGIVYVIESFASDASEQLFNASILSDYQWPTFKGNNRRTGNQTDVVYVSIDEGIVEDLPESFMLNQNYPNPFNPTTAIPYALPEQANVRIEVYNMLGQLVATIVNETRDAGWHAPAFDARALSSGVYIYRLQAGSYIQTRKMLLLK